MIKLRNITKIYSNSVHALNGISLDVQEGEWLSIMGPSGSGKTTLMNIMGGFDRPTGGSVTVGKRDITGMEERELTAFRRENFGYVFQQFHLVPYLNALENVMLAQYFKHKWMDDGISRRAEEVLASVGLDNRMTHFPGQLSSGEQQRVSIARALVNKPKVIFADEPTGNLDQKTGEGIMRLFATLNDEGRTIVMITHSMDVARLGSRIIKMVDGRITNVWRKKRK